VKKILLTSLCAAVLMSCSSSRGMANSAIVEAKTLQTLAKDRGVEVPASAAELIATAEKQKEDKPENALVLADEATLQLQLALLKQENKNLSDSLGIATGSLTTFNNLLETRKNIGVKK
jgi:cell shape-determining protein MreC